MYKVKTVVTMTGIPRNTLVAWERRYQLFETHRLENGYRLYSDADVALLRRLKALVDEGLSISEAVRLVGHEGGLGPTPRRQLWEDLLAPLLAFDRAGAQPFFRRVELLPVERAIDEVYRPLLHEVGRRWACGGVNVAQEHFASGVVREELLTTFRQLDGGPVAGPEVACACVPGESHDIGLLIVAIRLALRGWRVTWLGADLPLPDLAAYLADRTPRLVCLSSMRRGDADQLARQVREIREQAPPATVVVVGGIGVTALDGPTTDRIWYHPDDEGFFAHLGASPA